MIITLDSFFAVMSILIGFTCLVLSIFLLSVPSARRLSNIFLALFLLLTAIEVSAWIWVTEANQQLWPNAFRLALGKFQMPLFYGFIVASCFSDFKLKPVHSVNLIPFTLALILTLPGSQIPYASDSGTLQTLYITSDEARLYWLASHIIYYFYIALSVFVLVQFRRLFQTYYAGRKSDVFLWLTQMVCASIFAHTLVLVRDIFDLSGQSLIFTALRIISAILVLIILTWIALKSLIYPHIFRTVDKTLVSASGLFGSSKPNIAAQQNDIEKIQNFMETEKPFLDPEINLTTLANMLALTPRELSETINQSLDTHFFDFINGYRIRYAQERLAEDRKLSITVLIYESGFNSKSSFNAAFKKYCAMTPSQYKATLTKSAG